MEKLENKSIVKLIRILLALEDIQVPETEELLNNRIRPLLIKKSEEDIEKFKKYFKNYEDFYFICDSPFHDYTKYYGRLLDIQNTGKSVIMTLDVYSKTYKGDKMTKIDHRCSKLRFAGFNYYEDNNSLIKYGYLTLLGLDRKNISPFELKYCKKEKFEEVVNDYKLFDELW